MRHERLAPHLEREDDDGEQQREGNRERESGDTRRAQSFAQKRCHAAVARELALDSLRRRVDRAVGRARGVAVQDLEHDCGEHCRDGSGKDEHEQDGHRSPCQDTALRFFPRRRVGNRPAV